MKKYIILIFLLNSCGYYKFDSLYQEKQYKKAYQELQKKSDSTSIEYKNREFKVIIHLVVSGHSEYLPILDSFLLNSPTTELESWYYFAKSWIRFISANTQSDFENILEILPTEKINDYQIETLRLVILAKSLIQLKRYDELLNIFHAENIAKKNSDLLYLQGLAHFNIGKDYDMAYKFFRQTINISINDQLKSLAYFHIGDILEKQNKTSLALDNYMKSWELEPNNAETNYRIGKLFNELKLYSDLSDRFLRATLRINENFAAAWYSLNIKQ